MSGPPQPKQPRAKKRRGSKAEFSEEVKAQVARRSLGHCEAQTEACWGKATLFHHIRRRKTPDGSAENAMHLCLPCHDWIHGHVALSEERGWLIRSGPLDS